MFLFVVIVIPTASDRGEGRKKKRGTTASFLFGQNKTYHIVQYNKVTMRKNGDFYPPLLTKPACCTVDSAAVGLALRKPMAP